MPEGGRYKELPRPESFRFFEERHIQMPSEAMEQVFPIQETECMIKGK